MANVHKPKINRDEWAMLVGRFILLFGDIENVTYLALAQLPTILGKEITPHQGFVNRVEQLVGLTNEMFQVEKRVVAAFVDKLDAAKRLSKTRNHVAHSPLMLTIYDHPKEGWEHRQVGLANARNNLEAMSFNDLQDAVEMAEHLVGSLYEIYARVYECIADSAAR